MVGSLEASLKKLRTSYVDILCELPRSILAVKADIVADIHWWDCESTSRLVRQSATPDCTPLGRDHADPGNYAGSQQPRQAGQRYVLSTATQSCTELIIPVLYLGVSDTPAWVISRANEYARNHGLAPFVSPDSLSCKELSGLLY